MTAALLSLESVTKRFGGLTAVRGVSLDVPAGELLGIIGPNGAGKTTLFNVISGFYRPDEGRIVFDGHEVTGLSPHVVSRSGLTRTFQIVKPFGNLSVLDNVMIGALTRIPNVRAARADAERVIETCGLTSHAQSRAKALPIGLRKRLEVARALATRPRLLLLDEPASGLDSTESEALGDLLVDLAADGMAVLVVEHDVDLVMRVCDSVHVLDFGRIIKVGTPPEVQNDPHVQAAYLGTEDPVGEDAL